MATTRARRQQGRTPTQTESEKAMRLGLATARRAGLSDTDGEDCVQRALLSVLCAGWRGEAQFARNLSKRAPLDL